MKFFERFQEAVKISGISYAELARRLQLTKATVSMYKSGKALPSLPIFEKICDILDVSADFLLGRTEF